MYVLTNISFNTILTISSLGYVTLSCSKFQGTSILSKLKECLSIKDLLLKAMHTALFTMTSIIRLGIISACTNYFTCHSVISCGAKWVTTNVFLILPIGKVVAIVTVGVNMIVVTCETTMISRLTNYSLVSVSSSLTCSPRPGEDFIVLTWCKILPWPRL